MEVTFFVRTFFFIFTGMMFNLEALTGQILIIGGVVFLTLLLARIMGVMVLRMSDKKLAPFGKIITSMMAHGLAAAVLATTLGVFVLERKNVMEMKSQERLI